MEAVAFALSSPISRVWQHIKSSAAAGLIGVKLILDDMKETGADRATAALLGQ